MPTVVQDSVVIALNTRNPDVLAGYRNALIDVNGEGANVSAFVAGSAAGLFADLFVGKVNAIERSAVGAQNRFPTVPDDVLVAGVPGLPNERVTMPVENTTGGALTLFFRIEIDEG